MKLFKLSSLTAAILATTSGIAQADFINDSTLDIKLRNAMFDWNQEGSENDAREWSQSVELNLKSGYIADMFGFDASYYGAIPLDHTGASKYSPSSKHGELLGKDGKGYHKLGQAYAKAKFGDDQLGFYGQAGYILGKNGLIKGSASRSTPASYRGLLAEMNVQDFWLHTGYVDRIGHRTETSWDDLTTSDGTKIDNAWQVGGKYNANNLLVDTTYLESKDYQKQYTATVGYTFDLAEGMSLLVEGIYFEARDNGNLWDKVGFDDKGHTYNLTTQLNVQSFGVALTYGQTKAKQEGDLGFLDYRFANNDYGTFPLRTSRYWSDFYYDGQKVWQLEGSYNFADLGLPGLNTSLTYTTGKDMNDPTANKMEKETETDLIASYTIQEGALKGLSFKIIQAWHNTEFDGKSDEKTTHTRAYIDYTISVF